VIYMEQSTDSYPNLTDSDIDLEQLSFNLSLTPEQRPGHHQAALDLILELKSALKQNEAKPE